METNVFRIFHNALETVQSTQTLAEELIQKMQQGDEELLQQYFGLNVITHTDVLLLTAKEQTHGKGQSNRTWLSPEGNIHATYIIPWPKRLTPAIFHIPQLTALALCKTIERFNLTPQIKWINDVLLSGKKVAGVLCTNCGDIPYMKEEYSALIIGIGFNVNLSEEQATASGEFKDDLSLPITSLSIEGKKSLDLDIVQHELSQQLVAILEDFLQTPNFENHLTEIDTRLAYKERIINYQDSNQNPTTYTFKGIDSQGRAIVESESGKLEFKMAGRIRLI